jgi:ferritin-like metal-binding protein YciE
LGNEHKPKRVKLSGAFSKRARKSSKIIKDSGALDAGLLAAGQAVEHYEISRYGTLKTWATRVGLKDAATLLDQNLQEEKKTDVLLSKLAEASINAEAA